MSPVQRKGQAMDKPERITVFTGAVPYADIPHAGGRYLEKLRRELSSHGEITYVAPDTAQNRVASAQVGANSILIGTRSIKTRFRKYAQRAIGLIERGVRLVNPGCVALEMKWAIITDRRLREVIQQASIIDLQWAEYVALAPAIRKINPEALIMGTYHDVLSQLFGRNADKSRGMRKLRWRLAASFSNAQIRRTQSSVSEILTLNEKDAELLAQLGSHAHVVHPPLGESPLVRNPSPRPTAIYVGYFARAANLEAAAWLINEVWPKVRHREPEASLRLVGADPSGKLAELINDRAGIEQLGFVHDIWQEYATATVSVVPLLSGSGVKFKAIEALVAGVPCVTTSIGAEGIGGTELFTAITDDSEAFANAILRVFANQAAHKAMASRTQTIIRDRYGATAFATSIRNVYSLGLREG